MRRLIIATSLLVGLTTPVWAAGQFDGEWVGELVATDRSSVISCGFEKTPIHIRIEGQHLEVTSKDGLKKSRTFAGDVSVDGRINAGGRWDVFYDTQAFYGNGVLEAKIVGQTVEGNFYASGASGQLSCLTEFVASRSDTKSAEVDPKEKGRVAVVEPKSRGAGQFDGEWMGRVTADEWSVDNCGFTDLPFRAQVEKDHFIGIGKDGSKEERVIEGEIETDGKIIVWSKWTRQRSASENLFLAEAEFTGRFEKNSLKAQIFTNTDKGNCSAKISLRRITSQKVQLVRQEYAGKGPNAEPARLKAEAERQRIADELAALKAEAAERRKSEEAARLRAEAEVSRRAAEAEEQRKALEAERLTEAERKRKAEEVAKAAEPSGELELQLAMLKRLKERGLIDDEQFKDQSASLLARAFGLKQGATAPIPSQQVVKSVDTTDIAKYANVDFGEYHALVIGNNDYKYLPDLKTAKSDAETVAKVLRDSYGFKVTLLTDATRLDVLDAFDEYREKLGEADNLLIYYAGHGWLDEAGEQGYWLPVDAKKGRRGAWISNGAIATTLKALEAKHVMVVADSCFSGTLVRGIKINGKRSDYIQRMAQKRARVVMTSGGLEPVADLGGGGHSPFAKAFIDVLSENRGVVDGTGMFSQLRRSVMLSADQTPEYSDARRAGHDGGDFLFVRRQ